MSSRASASDDFWGDVDDDVALRRFRSLVSTIDEGVYQLDPDGYFVAVNDQLIQATGYPREQLLGEHVSLVLADDDVERIEREIERQLETDCGDVATFEFGFQTAGGDVVPCELRINRLVEGGTFQGTIGVARDIRDEQTIETIWDSIATLDADGRFVIANEAFCEMTGYRRDELLGEHVTLLVDESVNERAKELQAELLGNEQEYATIEFEIETADGKRVPVESQFGPYTFEDGSVGRTGALRDIADRRDRKRELLKYETIVETVNDGIYTVDADGRFTMVNDAYCDVTGYSREELLGSHVSLVVDDETADQAQELEAEI